MEVGKKCWESKTVRGRGDGGHVLEAAYGADTECHGSGLHAGGRRDVVLAA